MPEYSMTVYESAEQSDGDFYLDEEGTFTIAQTYEIVYSDDDTLGLGDAFNGPANGGGQTETGANPVIVSVNGDTNHAWVGTDITANVYMLLNGDTGQQITELYIPAAGSVHPFYFVIPSDSNAVLEVGESYSNFTAPTGYGAVPEQSYQSAAHQCFTTGMRFETENGLVAVEDLNIGDMVMTHDRGLQPVRFIYRRQQSSMGAMRPVVFEKGALGNNERFVVSQAHRIHSSSFTNDKDTKGGLLVEAVELLNGSTIHLDNESKVVEYFHVMFDNHELVMVEGVLSESWQPHKRNLKRDAKLREELLSIFPEIALQAKAGVSGAIVRPRAKIKSQAIA